MSKLQEILKYLEPLAISIIAVFAPVKAALVTVLILTIVDLITGVVAARKRGERISSAQLRRTISKIVIYELAMCVGFLAEHYLMSDALPVLKLISGMIGLVETKSIFENLDSIGGNNLLKSVINKLGSTNQP